jgi:hypothetical protein
LHSQSLNLHLPKLLLHPQQRLLPALLQLPPLQLVQWLLPLL